MKGYLDGPYGQIHYRRHGDGPLLFCLHQSPVSGSMFEPAFPFLANRGFTAVALDTPGYGASDTPPDGVEIADYADALVVAIRQFTGEPVYLLGHHTGASIAMSIAARYPELVSMLVLNGVALFSEEERAFFATFKFAPLEPEADGSHLLSAWEQRLAATPGWTNLDAMHRHLVSMLAVNRTYHYGFKAAFRHKLEADLMAIQCPTMILTNSGDDLYAASQRAAARRPDFAYAALEGGTHDIVDEQPQAWANAVADFLQRP